MIWMENFFFCFSVRLGVLIISSVTFLSLFVPWVMLIAYGLSIFNPIVEIYATNSEIIHSSMAEKLYDMMKSDALNLLISFHMYFIGHMLASISAAYGALTIQKYFLIPMIICELIRFIMALFAHTLLMMACKHMLDLGLLITFTLLGGFIVLYFGYGFCTCVALYQIIGLINSSKYKKLYGDDPFNPLVPLSPDRTALPLSVGNSSDKMTLTSNNIRTVKAVSPPKTFIRKTKPVIISVLPPNFKSNQYKNVNNNKRMNWSKFRPIQSPGKQEQEQECRRNHNVNYNYWQWSELAPQSLYNANKRTIFYFNDESENIRDRDSLENNFRYNYF
ncbi:uncharacterized protein ACN427_008035 [Glossina fuscipes fuscipes]